MSLPPGISITATQYLMWGQGVLKFGEASIVPSQAQLTANVGKSPILPINLHKMPQEELGFWSVR